MVVESKNVMTEEQNKEPTLACVSNHQHCSDDDSEEDPEEDPVVVIDEDPEEDPNEEIYEESDQDPEDVIYEEPEKNPEKEMDEEDPEEEIVEDPEEDSEEEMDVESDEEELVVENSHLSSSRNGSAVIKDLEHKLNEGRKEERGKQVAEVNQSKLISNIDTPSESHHSYNMTKPIEDQPHYILKDHVLNSSSKAGDQFENASKFGSVTLEACKLQKKFWSEEYLQSESDGPSAVRELDSEVGLPKVIVNGDCTSKLEETGRSSRKHKHSRWDHKQEEETPLIDGTSKRRKTRWDNDDSRNCLFQQSGFLSSLELSTDPKILSLKKRLMEINKMLQSYELYGNKPAEEISHSPKPDYNNLGISISKRIAKRVQKKLTKERQSILSQLVLTFKTPDKFTKKIFVPVEEYPTYNFIGLILGPKGYTQKKMEKETGAKILLRGKGSGAPDQDENLHVLVEADNQQALGVAVDMIEKLLIPVADQNNDHKRAQLVELAKLRGSYKDHSICVLCKEQGHRQYACPLKDSTFKTACCDICGSFGHSTSKCEDKSNQEVDVYVGYLSHATDEKRLKELFLPFGKIIKTTVIKDETTGLSKGYGFVKFDNPSDAAAAVTYMNGYKMDSKYLAVRVAGQKPVPGPSPTAVPSLISSQASCIFGPVASMLPQAQVSISNKESLCFPFSSGNFARTVALNIPPCVVPSTTKPRMTNNYSSVNKSYTQIPSSLPNSISQFPGNPDYPISQFKSYFTSPTLNEFQTSHFSQMPDTDQKSIFGSTSRLPWQGSLPK